MSQRKKIKPLIFLQLFCFILLLFWYPLKVASGIDKTPVLSPEGTKPQPEEKFKKAVKLLNTRSYKDAENVLLGFMANDLWKEKTSFLLGRLYKEQGFLDKAEDYLKKAAVQDFLLRDYVLRELAGLYISAGEFDKALETARQVRNETLLREAGKLEFTALLGLKRDEEAMRILDHYIRKYPDDTDSELALARLFKSKGEKEKAIILLKNIYINATTLSADALEELEAMDADTFTREEMLKTSENLFAKSDFKRAEAAYRKILKDISGLTMRDRVRFAIGMCQFRQKKYGAAAESFGLIKTPKAMFWKARSLYRFDDRNGFIAVIKDVERKYPGNKYLAELLLILADDLRRAGNLSESEKTFRKILKAFPGKVEDVFWGLGWMSYTNREYEKAAGYFSKLTSSGKKRDYYKYIYWEAKSRDMLSEDCLKQKNEGDCPVKDKNTDAYTKVSADKGYYGFLARRHFSAPETPDKIELVKPAVPEGRAYKRIETLKFLGLDKEAVKEINLLLRHTKELMEFKYLSYTAINAGGYKEIIYLVEDSENREYLPFSYPLGYWDIVKEAAGKESVDAYLVEALIREESRFDPGAVSGAGAVGLMQLMPSTAHRMKKDLKIELNDDSEIYDIEKNIFIGTYYLSLLIKEFNELSLAVAAYNAGESALRGWLATSKHRDLEEFIEDIPYKETRKYVKKVLRSYWQYRAINGLSPGEGKG